MQKVIELIKQIQNNITFQNNSDIKDTQIELDITNFINNRIEKALSYTLLDVKQPLREVIDDNLDEITLYIACDNVLTYLEDNKEDYSNLTITYDKKQILKDLKSLAVDYKIDKKHLLEITQDDIDIILNINNEKILFKEIKPKTLKDIIGQTHLLKSNSILKMLVNKQINQSIILYGESGLGKSALLKVIENTLKGEEVYTINATISKTDALKDIFENRKNKTTYILIDEIQAFNKKQQQILLKCLEDDGIIAIFATSENPYHSMYTPLVNRCIILQLKKQTKEELINGTKHLINTYNTYNKTSITIEDNALELLINIANYNIRIIKNILDILVTVNKDITKEQIESLNIYAHNLDATETNHYDLISALQKSIRGSRLDASLYYLVRLIEMGDIQSICRRLLVIASEDISIEEPQALILTKAAVDTVERLGLPEARITLYHIVTYLTKAKKSAFAYKAGEHMARINKSYPNLEIPDELKDAHYKGSSKINNNAVYKNPHDEKDTNKYLPETLRKLIKHPNKDQELNK